MNDILAKTQKYVTHLFQQNHNNKLHYHNLRHTLTVVSAAKKIGMNCKLDEEELQTLQIAAWFHDVGYLECIKNHEEISKQYARGFLTRNGIGKTLIDQVERCIDATRLPQNPRDRMSEVLCDADLFHVAQEDFMSDTQIFWDEMAAMNGEEMDEKKYLRITLDFLKNHQFQTPCCQKNLEPGKQANLKKLQKAFEKFAG